MINRFFDFVNFDHSTIEEEVAKRMVRVGSGYAALAIALFGVSFWLTGPQEFVPLNLVVSALLAGIAVARPVSPQFSILLAGTLGLMLIGGQLFLLGGLQHSPAVWLLVPSVTLLLVGMRRQSMLLAVASMAIVVILLVGEQQGWAPPRVALSDPEGQMAMSLFGSQALVMLLGFITLRARERLLEENRRRTAELYKALDDARQAQNDAEQSRNLAIRAAQEKEEFFANLTHEIRTPLAGIVGVATVLQSKTVTPEQQPYIEALNVSSREMGEVVDAMLDHARLSAGQFSSELSVVPLGELVQSLETLFADRAVQKGLGFTARWNDGGPKAVMADRIWLRRILTNLLANALKFTPAGTVALTLHTEGCEAADAAIASTPTHWLVAEVRDTGIGIPADKIEAIFQPFVQADASISRRFGGTGLGLTISRRLAQLMGGSLEVSSRQGEGSVFTLRLPVNEAAWPEGHPGATGAAPLASVPGREADQALLPPSAPKVLLVEDNPVNQLIGEQLLKLLGCEVSMVDNGISAVELAAGQRFDLVLMDLQMPGMDGISATRTLRQRERATGGERMPIFALTGNASNDYGKACSDAGMDGFLNKPIGLDALREVLRSISPGIPR